MDDCASSDHESVLGRPQREDRRSCTTTRDLKGGSRPHFRGRSDLCKTLREAPRRRETSYPRQRAPAKKSKLGHSAMKLLEDDLHARPTRSYEQRADLPL